MKRGSNLMYCSRLTVVQDLFSSLIPYSNEVNLNDGSGALCLQTVSYMAQFDQSLCLPASSTVGEPMYCPEYNRLRQLYDVAIRNWGLVILSPDSNSLLPLTTEIKEKA